MELELATTEQLIQELLGRSTFAGVVIRTEEITNKPVGGPMAVAVLGSMRLNEIQTSQLLTTAAAKYIDHLAERASQANQGPPEPDQS